MRLDNWLRGAMLPLCVAPAKGRIVACCRKAIISLSDACQTLVRRSYLYSMPSMAGARSREFS
jgi:hypothetical protein